MVPANTLVISMFTINSGQTNHQVPRKIWRKGHADLGLGNGVFGKGGSGFGIGGSGCVWGCGGELLVGPVLRQS